MANDFYFDGLYYDIISEESSTVAVVSGQYGGYSGQITIPSTVTNSNRTYTVVSIGANAFAGCTAISGVQIPSTIKTIENNAFWKCSNLQSIEIPDGVSLIMNNAFRYCTGLRKLLLGKNISSIEKYAFADCSNIEYIRVLAKTPPTMDSNVFIFANIYNSAIVHVNLGCKSAYSNANVWSSFANIIEDNSAITTIAQGKCGDNCIWELTSDSILSISGQGEMYDYSIIGQTDVWIYSSPWKDYLELIKYINIKEGVSVIGRGSFYNARNVKSLFLPNSLKKIGYDAFSECHSIKDIVIPNQVETICDYAFNNNRRLESIVIPQSVTSIGIYAFSGAQNITRIKSDIKKPFVISNNVFNDANPNQCVLYVPEGSKELYKSTEGWNKFTNIIEGENIDVIDDSDETTASYNDYLESGVSRTIITSYSGFKVVEVHAYLYNRGADDIYVDKLVIKDPSNNEIQSTYTSNFGTLSAYKGWNFSYTIVVGSYSGQWLEWYYTYKGNNFVFCSDANDPMDVSSVMLDTGKKVIGIFGLNGKRLSRIEKGINIIKYSDGSTKKIIINE